MQLNLQGMVHAVRFIENALRQSPGDDVALDFAALPPLAAGASTEQLLEQAAALAAVPQARPTPNAELLDKIVDKLVSAPNHGCSYSRLQLFYSPVSTNIAPNYYSVIALPICFAHVRLRLYANMHLGQDVEICQIAPDQSRLVAADFAAYGSMFEQREDLQRDQLRQYNAIRKFYNNKLRVRPQPYKTVEQVFNDLVVICYNCKYFNRTETSRELQNAAHLLLKDCSRAFCEGFALDIPPWVESMMEQQNMVQEKLHEARNAGMRHG